MSMSPPPLLEIRNLHVDFRSHKGFLKVLDGVQLKMNAGIKIGLVGESGCGKSTLGRAIIRLLPHNAMTRGEILFNGEDLLALDDDRMRSFRGRQISMILQDPTAALNPVYTIGHQLSTVIQNKWGEDGRRPGSQIREDSVRLLTEVGLADPERILDSYPMQLSGGMRQRVCVGLALFTRPALLIADEPGTSLDVTIQDQVLRLVRDLVEDRGTSVILITHSLGVVRETTDHVNVMYAGNIVEVASTQKLFANPLHPYTQGLMKVVPKLTGGGIAHGIPGRIPDYLSPPQGCRFNTRCPHVMEVCRRVKPPYFNVEDGHKVACFIYDKDTTYKEDNAVLS